MGRSLDHRLREHCCALKSGDLAVSALAKHMFMCDHQVDLSKAMVIDTPTHTQTRCMLESWHIQYQQAPHNTDRGTLPGLYAALLIYLGLTIQPSGATIVLVLLLLSVTTTMSGVLSSTFSFRFI